MSELEIYKGMVKKMKDDEIKEILYYLKNDDYCPVFADEGCDDTPYKLLDEEEAKLLTDYITNLQQKVEYYEGFEINKTVDKIRLQNNREYKEVMTQLEDYKSRCEKAVEYLEKPYRDNFDYSKAELLNILNGKE